MRKVLGSIPSFSTFLYFFLSFFPSLFLLLRSQLCFLFSIHIHPTYFKSCLSRAFNINTDYSPRRIFSDGTGLSDASQVDGDVS